MDIGSQLRQARETRGLSLAALAATTRIRPRVLEAIERNDVSVVAPPPYAQGFVTSYAREVGLDPADTVRSYFAQFQPPPPSCAPAEGRRAGAVRRPWIAVGAGAFLILAGVLFTSGRGPDSGGVPAARTRGAAGTAAVARSGVQPTSGSAAESPRAVGLAGATGPEAALQRAATAPAAGPPSPLVVTLQASDASWVAATADGTRVIYRTLDAGATETVRASREITIRVGNAGALTWSVNGRPGEIMGAPGAVRTVKLTR